jgi:hypothetical protein
VTSERPSLAFLLCVETGGLEQQSLLLARSIRRWAGDRAGEAIHAFRPRVGPRLGAETYSGLEELGVVLHEEVLNRDHHDYVHVNTTYAMLWAEEHLDAEIIVWCDSDKVFLSEPSSFDLPPGIDAAATGPYYHSRNGPKSAGPGDPFDPYWHRLYELAGVTAEPYLTALTDGRRVRAFWNGGLIVFRRSAGLAREWLQLFERVLGVGHVPERGILNLDQLTLAAMLARRPEAVEELDRTYNHNLALRASLPEPQRSYELADLVSVHYHGWFNRVNFLGDLRPELDRDSERYRWLDQFLPLEPTHRRPLPGLAQPPAKRPRGRRAWRRVRRRARRRWRRATRAGKRLLSARR